MTEIILPTKPKILLAGPLMKTFVDACSEKKNPKGEGGAGVKFIV